MRRDQLLWFPCQTERKEIILQLNWEQRKGFFPARETYPSNSSFGIYSLLYLFYAKNHLEVWDYL